MATLNSLRIKSGKPKTSVGQGRYSPNREMYNSKIGNNRRDAILGRYVPGADNTRPDAPLCVCCEQKGVAKQAQVVDHILPINQGGLDEPDNWQPLCYTCHQKKSAKERWKKTKTL